MRSLVGGIFFLVVGVLFVIQGFRLAGRSMMDEINAAKAEGRPPNQYVIEHIQRGVRFSFHWQLVGAIFVLVGLGALGSYFAVFG